MSLTRPRHVRRAKGLGPPTARGRPTTDPHARPTPASPARRRFPTASPRARCTARPTPGIRTRSGESRSVRTPCPACSASSAGGGRSRGRTGPERGRTRRSVPHGDRRTPGSPVPSPGAGPRGRVPARTSMWVSARRPGIRRRHRGVRPDGGGVVAPTRGTWYRRRAGVSAWGTRARGWRTSSRCAETSAADKPERPPAEFTRVSRPQGQYSCCIEWIGAIPRRGTRRPRPRGTESAGP